MPSLVQSLQGFKAWKSSEDDLLAAAELAAVDPEFAAEIPALRGGT